MVENEKFKKRTMELLAEIISSEAAKPEDETDYALIEECGELINSLAQTTDRKVALLSESEIRNRVKKITGKRNKPNSFIRPHKRITRAIAVACVMVLLCVSASAVCFVVRPEIVEGILAALQLDTGESIDMDGITFMQGGKVKVYDTIEAFLEEYAIDIMYPHTLPEGECIQNIIVNEENVFPIEILYTDVWSGFDVYPIGDESVENLKENAEIRKIGEHVFYVRKLTDYWIALTSDDRYTYYISYASEEGLQTLMESFR